MKVNFKKLKMNGSYRGLPANYNEYFSVLSKNPKLSFEDKFYFFTRIATKEQILKVAIFMVEKEMSFVKLGFRNKEIIMNAYNFLLEVGSKPKFDGKKYKKAIQRHSDALYELDKVNYKVDHEIQEDVLKTKITKDHYLIETIYAALDVVCGYYMTIRNPDAMSKNDKMSDCYHDELLVKFNELVG